MKLILPSISFIEELHDAVLQVYPGKPGTLHKEVLENVVNRPKHYVAYDRPNLHKICAVMAHTIAQEHPYTDANKRTALLTIIFTYRINGVFLEYANGELNGDFTGLLLWIVQGKPSIDEIEIQLQEMVEKYARSGLASALERITDIF